MSAVTLQDIEHWLDDAIDFFESDTRAIIKTDQANLWNSWGKDDIRRKIAKRAALDHLKLLLETSRLEPKWLKIDALAALMNALPVNNPRSTPSKGLRYQALIRRTIASGHLGPT